MTNHTIVSFLLVTAILNAQGDPPRISPEQAKDFRGQRVTVCGRIVSAGCTRSEGTTTFSFAPSSKNAFVAHVPGAIRPASEQELETLVEAQSPD